MTVTLAVEPGGDGDFDRDDIDAPGWGQGKQIETVMSSTGDLPRLAYGRIGKNGLIKHI